MSFVSEVENDGILHHPYARADLFSVLKKKKGRARVRCAVNSYLCCSKDSTLARRTITSKDIIVGEEPQMIFHITFVLEAYLKLLFFVNS